MSQENPFNDLARYYDWEHDTYEDDEAMYLEFARRTGDPVLELACGSGRILAPLAIHGFSVVGVDSSAEMLEAAAARVRRHGLDDRVALHQADMRTLALQRRFPLAIVALDSFGLLLDPADQSAALEAVYRHLDPGGLLILDLSNGNIRGGEARDELLLQHTGEDPVSGRPLSKWTARSTDFAEQTDYYTYMYDEIQEDQTVKRWTSQLALRYFGRFELELLLRQAGFRIEALYGSYDLTPFSHVSERLIAVAARPPGRG
ncbi:MAG: class I SAM-dependent methyltransferase [Chloroflexota bacterium]